VLRGHEFLSGGTVDRDVYPMTDNCGHGTHVAGSIAAGAENGLGIAGAAPRVKILPVRVLNCSGWSSDVAKGITWAANQGARVINLSVGGPGPDKALYLAVKYARSKGAVVVAAAGNNHGECTDGKNATSYPGATTGAIGVGAIDSALQHACFSNTGSYVDLVAPGVSILSTVPPAGYAALNGTSMATPHVSAAAALVIARRPFCTPDRVEARLKATALRLPLGTAGDARRYGAGLVNPALALARNC
jgi:subtilisin family serine protease